jgi:hypothetical protein
LSAGGMGHSVERLDHGCADLDVLTNRFVVVFNVAASE